MREAGCKQCGIYIHIPFCRQICPYCDFYSEAGRDNRHADLIEAIVGELRSRADYVSFWSFDTIYIGGGTPSLLAPGQMETILNAVHTCLAVSADTEVTVECNPSSIDLEKLSGYRRIGVNRLSIGIQSFTDSSLRILGRIHDSKMAESSYDTARRSGFENINIDLIYGLPGQSLAEWREDLAAAISLSPEHISAYNLIIEPNTPFGAMHKAGKLPLPDEDDQLAMYLLLHDSLIRAGYGRYEISNFSRPGKRCRHNFKYWRNLPYLGIGPSAISFDGSKRVRNVADIDDYVERVSRGENPNDSTETIDIDKAREERIMTGLRTAEGLSLEAFRNEFGFDLAVEKKPELELLAGEGLIEITGDRITIARAGLFVSDEIIVRLI